MSVAERSTVQPIAAKFNGLQEFPGQPSFALWTLLEDLLPQHPKGSTVSERTLRDHGYEPFNAKETDNE